MQKSTMHRLDLIAGALLGVAMLLLLRRYWGIDHDAALYMGQALRFQFPDILARDLFFAYESQGSFTLFPLLLSGLIRVFDVPGVFFWGSLLGLLGFAAASWYCLKALLAEDRRYWAWLGVLCLPALYGWVAIFSYSEPFLTPRLPAEVLSLGGLALVARGKWMPAGACLLAAALFHPLQAIGALLVVWAWLVAQDRRWLHALWLAIPLALLGYAGVRPFDGLLRQMDPAWLSEVHAHTRQVFVTGWNSGDYKVLLLDALLLGYAWRALQGAFGAWCGAALAGLALGLLGNLLLVDVFELVLPAQLQLWRVHWLAHWFAMAALACLFHRDLQAGRATNAVLLALACTLAWGTAGWMWLAFALLYATLSARPDLLRPRMRRLLGWLFGMGIVVLFCIYAASEWLQFRQSGYRLDIQPYDKMLLVFPAVSLGLPLLALAAWHQAGPRGRWLLFAGLLSPALAIAAIRWDAQPNMLRQVERQAFRPDLFGTPLPENAQVFWDKLSVIGPWLILNRADYYSPQQLSGLVFSKGVAVEGKRRRERMQALLDESLRCQDPKLPREVRAKCRVSDAALQQACGPGGTQPPDYLVLPYEQAQRNIGVWAANDPRTGKPMVTYWLYDCTDILKSLQDNP